MRESKPLLGVKDIMRKYGLGRPAATKIVELLPHLRIGVRRYVYESDLDALMKDLMESGVDIKTLTREMVKNGKIVKPEDKT